MSPQRLRALVASPAPQSIRSGLEKTFFMEAYSTIKAVVEGVDIVHIAQGLPSGLIAPPGSPGTPSLEDPVTRLDLAHCAESMAKLGALAERPYYQIRDELGVLKAELGLSDPQFEWITRMSTPSYDRMFEGMARAEAALGTAQIAAALRLYRDAEGGEYPASLEALRTVLPSPPLDPFTGKPFLYRREGTGFVVYSAGPAGNSSGVSGESDILFRSPR
jgi:hypothetical protein